MARNSSGIFNEVFAEIGDKAPPPFSIQDGYTANYSIPVTSGGAAPKRTTENYLLNQLYALGVDVNKMGGALQWTNLIQYDQYAYVVGSNGRLYSAVVSNIGIDPVTDGGTNWLPIPNSQELANQVDPNEGTRLIGHTGETLYTKLGQVDAHVRPIIGGYITIAGAITTNLNNNIASVVVGASGYTINFNITLPNANYIATVCANINDADEYYGYSTMRSTTSIEFRFSNDGAGTEQCDFTFAIFNF